MEQSLERDASFPCGEFLTRIHIGIGKYESILIPIWSERWWECRASEKKWPDLAKVLVR
jgi:hypothetical protein